MANIVHLEPEEFVETLFINKSEVRVSPYVLDCGIATMIYMFTGKDQNVYYMDRIFTSKQEEIKQMDPQIIHADFYRKVALDQRLKGITKI